MYVETEDLKMTADYTGLNFLSLLEMDCVEYKSLFRDAYVYKMKQTPEGQEYLENCWLLSQTKPDRQALRRKFKGGGD